MSSGRQWWRLLLGVALLAAVEGAGVLAFTAAPSSPAQAQWWNDHRSQVQRRQYQRRHSSGGFFGDLFGTSPSERESPPGPPWQYQPEPRRHVDYSRAPAARKKEEAPDPNRPITSVVVMGGSMADWLAYGLEDAFSDSPNVDVVRKDKLNSGLLHYQPRSDLDWWHVARDELAQQPANYVVMMIGVRDRQNIREQDVAKEAEREAQNDKKKDEKKDGKETAKADEKKDKPKPKRANGVLAFRTDEWAKVYSRRIDQTIAALKSKGVPVFWVGLPSIRGTRSTADAVYLNNLYRARAERAGVVYIDVWDGFVDDAGKYSSYGPDYEGQTRRLRSADGVFFTKYGARKLAHYVEREIRRYMSNRITTLTLPTGPVPVTPGESQSLVRPLAGPVLPLTSPTGEADVLLGASGVGPGRQDATAASVLVRGDALHAPPGRADDFRWPPDSAAYGKAPQPTAAKPPKRGSSASIAPPVATAGPAVEASVPVNAPGNSPAAARARVSPSLPLAPLANGKPQPGTNLAVKPNETAVRRAQAEAKKRTEERAARAEARRAAEEKARTEARHTPPAERTVQRDVPRPPGLVGSSAPRREPVRQRPSRSPPDRGGFFGGDGPFGWLSH